MGDIFLRLSNWLLYWCYSNSLANMGVHDRQGRQMNELLCAGAILASITIVPVLYLIVLRGMYLAKLRRQKYKEE